MSGESFWIRTGSSNVFHLHSKVVRHVTEDREDDETSEEARHAVSNRNDEGVPETWRHRSNVVLNDSLSENGGYKYL